MAQPAEILDDLVEPGIGIRRFVEASDQGLDKFARQPYHALIFGSYARCGVHHEPGHVGGQTEHEDQRQKDAQPGTQG